MLNQPFMKTAKLAAIALASFSFSLPGHAYQNQYSDHYGGTYGDAYGDTYGGSRSGSGMGMGSGSNSGYYDRRGYGYDYQRPPRPPMRPYGYQRPPRESMRPYGYQRPPREPMRPYGYRNAPMTPPAAAAAPAQTEAATAGTRISIQGMAYQPTMMKVKSGSTVTWVNNDSAPHTVTSTDGGPLASGTLNRGNSYSVTLDQPGSYSYYCKFHPNMRATIIVE